MACMTHWCAARLSNGSFCNWVEFNNGRHPGCPKHGLEYARSDFDEPESDYTEEPEEDNDDED